MAQRDWQGHGQRTEKRKGGKSLEEREKGERKKRKEVRGEAGAPPPRLEYEGFLG